MSGMDGFINFNGTLEGSIAGGGGGDVTDVKVRDSQETTFESVVNEEGVAKIDLISYVRRNELSQELMRLENDIDTELQRKQNIFDYSTTEQDIGLTWIDGSHIYQKTIILENISLANNSFIAKNISDYISNISMLISYESIIHNKTGDIFYLTPYSLYSTLTPYSVNVAIVGNEIDITTGSSFSSMNTDIYITFKYTKSA